MPESCGLDLAQKDLEIVSGILSRHVPDRPVFVFGSRATGKAMRRSDLDLAIGGGPLPPGVQYDLAEAFDESDLPITVDVVELATADEDFQRRIARHWLPLPVNSPPQADKELISA